MTATVTIRKKPTPADIKRLRAVAQSVVMEIAASNGSMGHDAIEVTYLTRIYAAIVARPVKVKRK